MIQLTLNLKSKKQSTVYALNGKTYRLKPGSNVLNLEYNDYVALAKALSISPIMEDPANVKKHEDPVKQSASSINKSEESDKVDELDNSVEETDKEDADDKHNNVEDTSAVDDHLDSEDSDNTEDTSHEDAVDEPVNDNMEDSVEDSNDNDSADNDELEEPHDTAEVHNEPETEDQIEDTADDSSVENEDQHEESVTEDVTTETVNESVNEDKESAVEDLSATDDNVEDKQLSEMVDYSTWSYNDLKAEYKNVTGKSCKLKKAEIIAFLQEHSNNAE